MEPLLDTPWPAHAQGFLDALLGSDARGFIDDVFGRTPLARPGSGLPMSDSAGWALVDRLTVGGCDLHFARNGSLWAGPRPSLPARARQIFTLGWTYVFRHAEAHDPDVSALAAAVARDLPGGMNIHVYATPPVGIGFGWHYDAEEVIILQAVGCKTYHVRENTTTPTLDPRGAPMRSPERSPIHSCDLAAGDWLHIPAGWWHAARARSTSISLSVGIDRRKT